MRSGELYHYDRAGVCSIGLELPTPSIAHGSKALDSNLYMLIEKRIDLTVEDASVLIYTANQLKLIDKVKPIFRVSTVPLFLGFSPKNPKSKEYAALASKRLREMKKDGTLAGIFRKYGIECPVCNADNK